MTEDETSTSDYSNTAQSDLSIRLRSARVLQRLSQGLVGKAGPFHLVVSPLRAVFDGMALGLLRRSDVEDMVAETYQASPSFYDPRRYQLSHETKMLPTLQRLAGERTELLDAFCGQGREAEVFARAGFDVTAIDRCGWMIDAAKIYAEELDFATDFLVADFASFQRDTPFEVVYTSLWMYSTVQGSENRASFLKQCRALTNADGLVVISCVGSIADSRFTKAIRFVFAKIVGCLTLGNPKCEWGERIYSGLFWHHRSDRSLRREVSAAGFRVVESIHGQGTDPWFYFLTPSDEDSEASGE